MGPEPCLATRCAARIKGGRGVRVLSCPQIPTNLIQFPYCIVRKVLSSHLGTSSAVIVVSGMKIGAKNKSSS